MRGVAHALLGATLALGLGGALGACARPPAGQVSVPRAPLGRAVSEPLVAPPAAAVDCSRPPDTVCCKALTEACERCREEASARARAWNRACVRTTGVKPRFVACDPARPELPCTPTPPTPAFPPPP